MNLYINYRYVFLHTHTHTHTYINKQTDLSFETVKRVKILRIKEQKIFICKRFLMAYLKIIMSRL